MASGDDPDLFLREMNGNLSWTMKQSRPCSTGKARYRRKKQHRYFLWCC